MRGARSKSGGKVCGGRIHLLIRNHLIHQSPFQCLVSGQHPVGQGQFHGTTQTDMASKKITGSSVRSHCCFGVTHCEL